MMSVSGAEAGVLHTNSLTLSIIDTFALIFESRVCLLSKIMFIKQN